MRIGRQSRWDAFERRHREQRAAGNSDEGMQDIPKRIEAGNFIGKKLDNVEGPGGGEHIRAAQNLQTCGQFGEAEKLQSAQHKGNPIEVKPAHQRRPKSQGQAFDNPHYAASF